MASKERADSAMDINKRSPFINTASLSSSNLLPVYEEKYGSEGFENFKWLGNLEYPKGIRQFLSEIDIYALISGIDMAPLTLLEAQLMKKPIIATSVGGIPELMKDGKTGFLTKKGNDVDIIEKISILMSDKNLEFGENGRNFVTENFSLERISEDFLKFINEKFKLS